MNQATPHAPSFADDTGFSQAWAPGTTITPVTVPIASGSPTPTYAVVGNLPAAISFNTTTRVISGTPDDVRRLRHHHHIRATNSEGSDDWTVAYTIAIGPSPPPAVTLEIDFDNDGTFGHAAADVTGDLVRHSLRTTRGRTLQSRRKATAGRLEARLWNLAAKYDPSTPRQPIYQKELTGVRVRVQLNGETVWGGILDRPRYRQRPVPQLDIIALGKLASLRQPVSVAAQASLSIGAIAKLVGNAIGLVTTHLTGGKTLDRWKGVKDQDALTVLQDLEEHEEGFLFERLDGELELDAENARATGDSATSALTLKDQLESDTDVPVLRGTALDWGFRYIANVVRVPVESLAAGTAINLWTSSNLEINAGVSFTIRISYPEDTSPLAHRGVVSWIQPVAGTDYTAQTGLSITGVAIGDSYTLTISNTSASTISVGTLNVRGIPLVAADIIYVESKDPDSITTFGEREYSRPSPLYTTIGDAKEYADGIVSRRSTPKGWLVARWPAYYAVQQALGLDLSRRITVERLGETLDYYIEGTSIALRGFVRMEYLLSPVPGLTRPSAPVVTVENVAGETTHLAVSWSDPYNGGSVITGYDVRDTRKARIWLGLRGRIRERAEPRRLQGLKRGVSRTTYRYGLPTRRGIACGLLVGLAVPSLQCRHRWRSRH